MESRRKPKRDFLDAAKVAPELLSKDQEMPQGEDPLNQAYRNYTKNLKAFPILTQVQRKKQYASCAGPLTILLQFRWRQKALDSIKSDEELAAKRKQRKESDQSLRELSQVEHQRLIDRMKWWLVGEIRRSLIARGIGDPRISSVLAGRLAMRGLFRQKGVSLTNVAMEEARFMFGPRDPKQEEHLEACLAFAMDEFPKLVLNGWLKLNEWRGGKAPLPAELRGPEQVSKTHERLKTESMRIRKFYGTLVRSHAECLAAMAA